MPKGELDPNGTLVRKVSGLPFGGVPCKQCGFTEYAVTNGEIDGGRRVSAKHPEGWSHIFDPAQLEAVSPQPTDEAREGVVEAAERIYQAWADNDPLVHCNRFPLWEELPVRERERWLKVAAALSSLSPDEGGGE